MHAQTPSNPNSQLRLFESDLLEKFTHVHPLTPLLLWGPVVGFLLFRAVTVHELSWLQVVSVAMPAIFVWTLFEYALHRYVFHLAGDSEWKKRFVYIIHGLHHADPNDATRLVMPPVPAIILAVILYTVFRLVLGPVWTDPCFAFFIVGYLIYDYTHFATHHFSPRTAWGKAVKQHHMLHHFKDHEARWGVSSPFWDHVFRTMPKTKRKS